MSLAIIWIIPLVGSAVALWVVYRSQRAQGAQVPTCGHCGYDLTGSAANRCPECGKLFIEAGIEVGDSGRLARRQSVKLLILVLGLVVPATLAVLGLLAVRQRAARAQAALIRAQQAQAAAAGSTTATPVDPPP